MIKLLYKNNKKILNIIMLVIYFGESEVKKKFQ